MGYYPEYSGIIQLLIEQIKQGKERGIAAKLQELEYEDW